MSPPDPAPMITSIETLSYTDLKLKAGLPKVMKECGYLTAGATFHFLQCSSRGAKLFHSTDLRARWLTASSAASAQSFEELPSPFRLTASLRSASS
jgi:hypothetical protein